VGIGVETPDRANQLCYKQAITVLLLFTGYAAVNSGSQTIPQSSATWLPVAFRIRTFRKETATGPH
jgi:hypothetical protein